MSKYIEKYNKYLKDYGYKFVKLIEHENFPIVEYQKGSERFVVKILDCNEPDEGLQIIIMNEVKINQHLIENVTEEHKKHIMVGDLSYDDVNNVFFLIMEKMQGTLFDIKSEIFIKNCNQIISKIIKCIHILHKYNVVHSDLKPDNIFYRIDKGVVTLKLGDFGLSNMIDADHAICGQYMPQEMIDKHGKMDDYREIDYLQLSIALYCMFTDNHQEFYQDKTVDVSMIHDMFKQVPNRHLSGFLLDCLNKIENKNKDISKKLYSYINNNKRCLAKTKNNRMCKNKGKYFGYCKQHRDLFVRK